jgi:hypothetical protein
MNSSSLPRRLPLVLLALAALAALPGCGGGGTNYPASAATTNLAPQVIAGHTFIFTDPHQSQVTTTYVFSITTYTSPSGDSGTYTYLQSATTQNQGTVHIVSSFSPALTYTLTYTTYLSGTYVDQVGNTGPFTMQ